MKTVILESSYAEPLIELFYFDAGGGHRAAAAALHEILISRYPSWRVEMVNLRSVLEPIDFIRRLTGIRVEDFYNGILKTNLTAGIGSMLHVMHLLIRHLQPRMAALLAERWRKRRPALVVSLIPHFNRALFDGLQMAAVATRKQPSPFVTILTDLADYPPHFWLERQNQFVVCGTSAASQQALALGLRPEQILATSGMIVRSDFYRPLDLDRAAERIRLGLEPNLLTGIVMYGGFGSGRIEAIVRRVAESRRRVQLIFLCGHNVFLRERLATMRLPFPAHATGFTAKVPYFMKLADFFIGKPGPGSISEALVMGLPLVVERTRSTMVHERFNVEWILRNEIGVVLRSFQDIDQALKVMLDASWSARVRSRIASLKIRALFEIPELLHGLLFSANRQEFLFRERA